jgi:hypothetical protein
MTGISTDARLWITRACICPIKAEASSIFLLADDDRAEARGKL